MQLSKNFKLSEFMCNDNTPFIKVNMELVYKLQKLRDIVNLGVRINSAYRTPEYNRKVGGANKSQHVLGNAADIVVFGYTPTQLSKIAEQIGFDGIGIYNSFLHVDVRGHKARWIA